MTNKDVLVCLFAGTLLVILFQRGVAEKFREALDNFRGGGPGPMHPVPGDERGVPRRARRDEAWKARRAA